MKILVSGDRFWNDPARVESVLDECLRKYGTFILIEGGAPGADHCAAAWARNHPEVTHKPFPAKWTVYGRAAGPIRNTEMLREDPDLVLAFHSNLEKSRGTKDMVNKARKANIPVRFYV